MTYGEKKYGWVDGVCKVVGIDNVHTSHQKIDKWDYVTVDGKRVYKKVGFYNITIQMENLGPDPNKPSPTSYYPKESAPISQSVYQAANDRADRWMKRHDAIRAERDSLLIKLKEYEDAAR